MRSTFWMTALETEQELKRRELPHRHQWDDPKGILICATCGHVAGPGDILEAEQAIRDRDKCR